MDSRNVVSYSIKCNGCWIGFVNLNRAVKVNRFSYSKKRYIMQKNKKKGTFLHELRLAYKYLSFINVKISSLHRSKGYLNM
jgi:hypothetical protein